MVFISDGVEFYFIFNLFYVISNLILLLYTFNSIDTFNIKKFLAARHDMYIIVNIKAI